MRAKVVLLLLVASLFSSCLLAQQQKKFYYYKGDSISLNVNTQHFLLLTLLLFTIVFLFLQQGIMHLETTLILL